MISRRTFLQGFGAAISLSALDPASFAQSGGAKVGLQLYSVRKLAGSQLPKTLARLKQIGYAEVETYWNLYTHPADELRQMISDAGLEVPSGHFDYEKVEGSFDYAKKLGLQYMVCPMLPKSMQKRSADDFKRAAEKFNVWGARAQQAGLKFAFHNHNYEFTKFGDTTGYEVLLSNTDPKLVWMEMDCYWITQAGLNPVNMIHKLGERVRLLHLKDRLPGVAASQTLDKGAEHFTEVGTGTLDFKAIVQAAKSAGVEHYFVEQDEISKPPFESLTISFKNAERILSV